MISVISVQSNNSEDRVLDRESFFVAVCDCDASSYVPGFGCVHPYHVAPESLFGFDDSGAEGTAGALNGSPVPVENR